MPIPRILLISRKSLVHNEEAIKEQLASFGVAMAVAVAPEDAEQAKKLTEAIGQFQHVTAIVADFPFDAAICEDGSVEVLGMTVEKPAEEPTLITGV
jgi:hypothetical protein